MERESDPISAVEDAMEAAEESDDSQRLETLEKMHETLESELNEGAETPPA